MAGLENVKKFQPGRHDLGKAVTDEEIGKQTLGLPACQAFFKEQVLVPSGVMRIFCLMTSSTLSREKTHIYFTSLM